MAQMTPEEFLEALETWADSLKNGTSATKSQSEAMLAQIGITKEMTRDFQKMGKSAADFTKAMYKGQTGAAAMGDAVDTVTTGLQLLIGILMPGSLLLKAAVSITVGAIASYGKAAAKMSDDLYKSYQDLSRVGAAGAQGMDAVYGSMQKFGYGIDELDRMTDLIKANSKGLAMFSGTVADGAKQLAGTAEGIQRSGLQAQFMNMGMSVDDINKGIAGYTMQQGRLGQLQGKTQAELTAGAAAYLREMEGLTRLTGQQKEELEAQREQANSVEQFFATVSEMPDHVQKEMYRVVNIMNAQDPSGKLARGFQDSISGFVGMSKESNQAFMATSGENMRAGEALKRGTLNAGQYMNRYTQAVGKNLPTMMQLGKIGQASDTFGALNIQAQLVGKDYEKASEAADDQLNVTDDLTKSATELRQKQMQTRDSLQDFVKMGVKPATEALNALAGGARNAASVVPGANGDKAPMGGSSGNGWLRDLFGLGPAGNSGSNVDKILATIKARESSGGDYTAQNPTTSASGAYQFVDETWQGLTKKYGIGTEYTKAKLAPKDIQDAVAAKYVQEILKQSGGDVSKVPLAWYTGNIQGNISQQGLSANKGLTPQTYQSNWMSEYSRQSGPSGGYKAALSKSNPAADIKSDPNESYQQTLAKTLAAGNNSWDNEDSIASLLAESNALLRDQLSMQEKIKNNTAN
jgi:hypothetical protein